MQAQLAPVITTRRDRWKTAATVGLLVASGALALSLLGGSPDLATSADAQAQAGRPSDYVLLPASLNTANQEVLYVLDTQSGELTAAAVSRQGNRGTISFINPIPLREAFQGAGG
jgi:hypothetical protein